jgi:hypothetical protein
LQTTIAADPDDWSIDRFSLLREHLSSLRDEAGRPLCAVVARNREVDSNGDDRVLSTIDRSDLDELWLFAVDVGNGLSPRDCAAITRFHQQGGGILSTRDHQDLGSSLCTVGGVGAAHFFHTRNPEPDTARRAPDDVDSPTISWPNYHSGRNGDYQIVTPVEPVHPLLRIAGGGSGVVAHFPAHPHEGAVGVPAGERRARTIATGRSRKTGRPFDLVVAFEAATDAEGNALGRAVAESSFHHFADYNWDPDRGAPSFVTEPPGDGVEREPHKLDEIKAYVRNLARWLAPELRR